MARATLKLKRPITDVEVDIDENSLVLNGWIRTSDPQTNADRIRTMSDEELAAMIVVGCQGRKCPEYAVLSKTEEEAAEHCWHCWLNWLQSPVKEDDDGD